MNSRREPPEAECVCFVNKFIFQNKILRICLSFELRKTILGFFSLDFRLRKKKEIISSEGLSLSQFKVYSQAQLI